MKRIRLVSLLILVLMLVVNIAEAQSPIPTPPTSGSRENPISTSAFSIQYNTLYASANSDLWLIDTNSGTSTYIGPIGYEGTDIAFDGTNLYGVSFSDFLSIDPTTGAGNVIGHIGYNDVNALTIGLDGIVYAATVSGMFLRIDKSTGTGTLIGYFGQGMGSSGDLAYRKDNVMFASIFRDGYYNSWLAQVDMVNGTATVIGDIGYPDVFGLSFKDDVLYGVSAGGDILRINTSTGTGTSIGTSSASFWGLSTSGKALTGSITSPSDNYTTGPASFQINAVAEYPGGTGIRQVEFYVFYDNEWHSAGLDLAAPYTSGWETPPTLQTQRVLFRIDVVGNDGYRADYAGGVRHVNILQSYGDPSVAENWIPRRAYLNQRSLSPHGDWKCNVSSIAMVLAMEGFIGLDYQSMAAKANEMYSRVAPGDQASVYTVWKELKHQGADAYKFEHLSASEAWPLLKAYIDSGHPVILDSLQGIATRAGHFVVSVGYQEAYGKHYLITYDPFGQWRGTLDSYYMNAAGDPRSHVGQWVYYDFDKFIGNNVYLIAAHSPSSGLALAMGTPSTAPDLTSDEPRVAGSFNGSPQRDWSQVYIPLIVKNLSTTPSDTYEPNNSPTQAYGPLTSDTTYASYLSSNADVDYYYFDISTLGQVTIDLSNIGAPDSDYDLYLYDSSGQEIGGSWGVMTTEQIVFQPSVTGRYFIQVYPYSGANPTRPYYLKAQYNGVSGAGDIHGTVYANGSPKPNMPIILDFHDYSTNEYKTVWGMTNGSGQYHFRGMRALGPNQVYYAYYNGNLGPTYIGYWYSGDLTTYIAGSTVTAGDFDISPLNLGAPNSTTGIPLPVAFTWVLRLTSPTETYRVRLYDPNNSGTYYWTSDLGSVSSFTLYGLPSGFTIGHTYRWQVYAFGSNGSSGSSYYANNVSFSSTGVAVQSAPVPSDPTWGMPTRIKPDKHSAAKPSSP